MSDSSANGGNVTGTAILRRILIEKLKADGNIQTAQVEAAFNAVPRHLFLPQFSPEKAYRDEAIPTKFENGRAISSSSQPAIMAIMLEQLDLQPGHHVLEIGAGTGYNAALMAHIVGKNGRITTIDLDEDIAEGARQNLNAAGYAQVDVVCGDGMEGYAGNAPYDCIILTVGGWDIAPAWLEQLRPDGRILLPLSLNGPQFSVAFDYNDEHLASASIRPCGFMRIRGERAEPVTRLQLGPEPGLLLGFVETNNEPRHVETEEVYQWLTGSSQDRPTRIEATPRQIWSSLHLWLALHEPDLCDLTARAAIVDRNIVPYLFGSDGEHKWRFTRGVLEQKGLSVLVRPPGALPPSAPTDSPPPPFPLFVRSFGPDSLPAQRLIDHVAAWDRNGRPGIKGLHIKAFPIDADVTLTEDEHIVTKRWHKFVLKWEIGELEIGD